MNTSACFFVVAATLMFVFAQVSCGIPAYILGGKTYYDLPVKIDPRYIPNWSPALKEGVDYAVRGPLRCYKDGRLDSKSAIETYVASTVECFGWSGIAQENDECCAMITGTLKCVCNETLAGMVPQLVNTTNDQKFKDRCLPAISKVTIGSACIYNNTCAGGGLDEDAIEKLFNEKTECIDDADKLEDKTKDIDNLCCNDLQERLNCVCDFTLIPQSKVFGRCKIDIAKIGQSCGSA